MSDRSVVGGSLLPAREPVRIAVRRMRWFRAALHRYLEGLGEAVGCEFEVDNRRLAVVFVRWLRAVEAQKPVDPEARRAFFGFAGGLMLRELVAGMPVRAKGPPTLAPPDTAVAFWPEGYACTMFCIAVTSAALAQEFDQRTALAPALEDLRHWWSFRENAAEDPVVSVPFLEMFLGHEPQWRTPGIFSAHLHRELTSSPGLPRTASCST